MAAKLKLLGGLASPYTIRARIALELKGLDYDFVEEPFGPCKSDLLLSSNPIYKKIPVLFDAAGRPICESAVIVQYIDEAWPAGEGGRPAILPAEPYERAKHRFWTGLIDDKLWQAVDAISLAPTQEDRDKAKEAARAVLQLLEEAFKNLTKTMFAGDNASPGLLDISLGCFLPAIRACEQINSIKLIDEATLPHLSRWSDNFTTVGAVKRVLPATEKVLKFTRYIQDKVTRPFP